MENSGCGITAVGRGVGEGKGERAWVWAWERGRGREVQGAGSHLIADVIGNGAIKYISTDI